MSETPASPDSSGGGGRRVFGWVLVVLGGLWSLLTGGCGFVVIAVSFSEAGRGGFGGVPAFLVITAIFTAPGVAMLIAGLMLLRRPRPRPSTFD